MENINLKPLTPKELALASDNINNNEHYETDGSPVLPIPKEQVDKAKLIRDTKGNKPSLVVPYRDANGDVLFLEVRFDFINKEGLPDKIVLPYCWWRYHDGREEWESKQPLTKDRPLLNLPNIIKEANKSIMVVEGEKTAIAAARSFPNYTVTTSSGGCCAPNQTDWSSCKGHHVNIAIDHDLAGLKYGKSVYELCKDAGAASVRFLNNQVFIEYQVKDGVIANLDPPRELPPKYDLANAKEEGWTVDVFAKFEATTGVSLFVEYEQIFGKTFGGENIKAQKNSKVPEQPQGMPDGFRLSSKGVEYLKTIKPNKNLDDITEEWRELCGHLRVTHYTRNKHGECWGRILEIIDKDNRVKTLTISMDMLAGDGTLLREKLLDLGLYVPQERGAREKLNTYISRFEPPLKALCVDRVGWHHNNYVLPHKVYGICEKEKIVLQSQITTSYELKGTLQEWQENIGKYAMGNSRIQFAIMAALTAPFLDLLKEENFGFHFSGASSIGKTTGLHVAKSMWGNSVNSWRTTDNAAESLAKGANDALLLLDELSQVDGNAADAMAYMLGNGSGKARANRNGDSRVINKFRLIFLSSGEIGLEAKLSESKKLYKAGQSVRLIEIPADAGAGHGIFENLHGFENGDRLATYFRKASDESVGSVINRLLEWLVVHKEDATKLVQECRETWLKNNPLAKKADGQIGRVARKFAFIAAVGEVATQLGLLPWSTGEASKVCTRIFNDWLQQRGGNEPHEFTETISRLKLFIEEHGNSRFEDITKQTESNEGIRDKIYNQAGYKKWNDTKKCWDFYFFTEFFRKEVLKGRNQNNLPRMLFEKGFLEKNTDNNLTKNIRIFGKQQRLYCISSDQLDLYGSTNE